MWLPNSNQNVLPNEKISDFWNQSLQPSFQTRSSAKHRLVWFKMPDFGDQTRQRSFKQMF